MKVWCGPEYKYHTVTKWRLLCGIDITNSNRNILKTTYGQVLLPRLFRWDICKRASNCPTGTGLVNFFFLVSFHSFICFSVTNLRFASVMKSFHIFVSHKDVYWSVSAAVAERCRRTRNKRCQELRCYRERMGRLACTQVKLEKKNPQNSSVMRQQVTVCTGDKTRCPHCVTRSTWTVTSQNGKNVVPYTVHITKVQILANSSCFYNITGWVSGYSPECDSSLHHRVPLLHVHG